MHVITISFEKEDLQDYRQALTIRRPPTLDSTSVRVAPSASLSVAIKTKLGLTCWQKMLRREQQK